MKLKIIVVFLLFTLLTSCATQIPLKKSDSLRLRTVDHVLFIPQANMSIEVTSSDTGQAGIIGSLVSAAIDSVRRKNARKRGIPIQNALRGYDFRSAMLSNMNVASQRAKHRIQNRVATTQSDSHKRAYQNRSTLDAIMFTSINYHLISKDIVITAVSEMFSKTKPQKAIYKNVFQIKKQGVIAQNVRQYLNSAANDLAQQIILDLNNPV